MCLFKIKGATKCQDASASLDTYVLFKFSSPKRPEGGIFWQGNVEHLAISCILYNLDPSIPSISVVLIHEMGVFTYSNTSVGSDGLFIYISFKLFIIAVIFTEHVLTIAFIPVTLFISQETEGLHLIICENNKLWFFSPYFLLFCWSNKIFWNI